MGFDCVWISPVVQQPSGRCGASGTGYHGYWAQDWCAAYLHTFNIPEHACMHDGAVQCLIVHAL